MEFDVKKARMTSVKGDKEACYFVTQCEDWDIFNNNKKCKKSGENS